MNTINVLDHGYVELLDSMGNDLTVVQAARCSFDKRSDLVEYSNLTDSDIQTIKDEGNVLLSLTSDFDGAKKTNVSKWLKKEDVKLINYLAKHNHEIPMAHIQLQFRVSMPEAFLRQIYKSRVGVRYTEPMSGVDNDIAWSEVSFRYIDASDIKFYVPEAFRKQSKSNKQASTDDEIGAVLGLNDGDYDNYKTQRYYTGFGKTTAEEYDCYPAKEQIEHFHALALRQYQELLDQGVAKEQARCILPTSYYTTMVMTCSLLALIRIIKLRKHEGAQYEIRQYADAFEKFACQVAPVSTRALLELI